jgi:hypothetical protein
MRVFAHAPYPTDGSSLVGGEKAGNFADSAVFCENLSRKHPGIQRFATEFPTRERREIFGAQGIIFESREFGVGLIALPEVSNCAKFSHEVDNKIINYR